jgi:hypothetical protein
MNKKLFIIAVLCLLLIPYTNAITGSIGNAKAIVTVDISKSNVLERTVLVRNVNNFTINVKLEAVDDLELITEILDKEFELTANEEKKARFKVTIPEEGTYNGNIVVFFNPPEGKGAGVVLQANLIIKAVGEGVIPDVQDDEPDVTPDNNQDANNNPITGSAIFETPNLENLDFGILLFIVLRNK